MKRICNRGSISVLRILSLLSSSSRSIVPQIRQVVSAKILHGWMMYFETILQDKCMCICVYRMLASVFVLCVFEPFVVECIEREI